MNLDTIIKNLDRTIAGKELVLSDFQSSSDIVDRMFASILSINIQELKNIRTDVISARKELYDDGV